MGRLIDREINLCWGWSVSRDFALLALALVGLGQNPIILLKRPASEYSSALQDFQDHINFLKSAQNSLIFIPNLIPPIHRPSKILNRPSKIMHSAASPRKKGKTLSLPLHAHSKHMGIREVLLGQGIF